MQPDIATATSVGNDTSHERTLYRKEFLKVVLGRAQYIAGKLEQASKMANTNLFASKDMILRTSEHFAQADIYVKHLINSPENTHQEAAGFNKNVFFEFTPTQMEEMKVQLDYISEALQYGLTATNGAEFKERTAEPIQALNNTITEMSALCGVTRKQR